MWGTPKAVRRISTRRARSGTVCGRCANTALAAMTVRMSAIAGAGRRCTDDGAITADSPSAWWPAAVDECIDTFSSDTRLAPSVLRARSGRDQPVDGLPSGGRRHQALRSVQVEPPCGTLGLLR